jgi:hypothetical protein
MFNKIFHQNSAFCEVMWKNFICECFGNMYLYLLCFVLFLLGFRIILFMYIFSYLFCLAPSDNTIAINNNNNNNNNM